MAIFVIPLKDLVIDPHNPVDLASIPKEKAIELIKKSYDFLSSTIDVLIDHEIATISYSEAKAQRVAEASKLYNRGVKKAESGDYANAIGLFTKVLQEIPYHVDARRNLAMAQMEVGNAEEAKNVLIDLLRIEPKDVWGYLLLGNIYAKSENDLETAERFYKKALELRPDDPFTLNNLATLMSEKGEIATAHTLYDKTILKDPQYPNSYLGLAFLQLKESQPRAVIATIDRLFKQPSSADPRSAPIYQNARELYKDTCLFLAQKDLRELSQLVDERRQRLALGGGHEIVIKEDESLKRVAARTQMAWKHSRDAHHISYRPHSPELLPHILLHELEHISLEIEARRIGRNKIFVSGASNRETAIRSIADDVTKLQRMGHSDDAITSATLEMVQGLTNQLFNCPLDMFIEQNLKESFPALWPTQFISLQSTNHENRQIFVNKEIQKLSPRKIYRANISMNCAYAIFIDWLAEGKTNYGQDYKSLPEYSTGQRLFEKWRQAKDQYTYGDEYHLVNDFASILNLQDWYTLLDDDPERTAYSPSGPTNRDLIKEKESATMMYCLSALERFEHLDGDTVREIAFEIGLLGQHGLDYASPDRKYSLRSLPGEQFSGLQLMAYMYVAFQRIDSSVDTGMDLKQPYSMALKMFGKRKQ